MIDKISIDKIREIPIVNILGISNYGKRISIKCPFHNEKTPSMVLYPDGSYRCYGCGKNGQNCIDFLLEMDISFPEAIEELKKYI